MLREIALVSLLALVVGAWATTARADMFCDGAAAPATRISVASDLADDGGGALLDDGVIPSVSECGDSVAFVSRFDDLVLGDTNGVQDVFVRTPVDGVTTRVSVATDGTEADGPSGAARISGDGRFVVFESEATNLVAGDTNGVRDVFVHDRMTRETTRVSVASDGTQSSRPSYAPSITRDGSVVAFLGYGVELHPDLVRFAGHIYLHTRATGVTSLVTREYDGTVAGSTDGYPTISPSGRLVAFTSSSNRLVMDDTNTVRDTFVYNTVSETITRISVAPDGSEADGESLLYDRISISADDRYVMFNSSATNLIANDTNGRPDAFIRDVGLLETTSPTFSFPLGGRGWGLSEDGRYVLFGRDETETPSRLVVYDAVANSRRSLAVLFMAGRGYNASLSADGRYVAFSTNDDLIESDTNRDSDIYSAPNPHLAVTAVDLRLTSDTTELTLDGPLVRLPVLMASNAGTDEARDAELSVRISGVGMDEIVSPDWDDCSLSETGPNVVEGSCSLGLTTLPGSWESTIPSRALRIGDTGDIEVELTMVSSTADSDPSNNSLRLTLFGSQADLEVTSAPRGGALVVTNQGPDEASEVTLRMVQENYTVGLDILEVTSAATTLRCQEVLGSANRDFECVTVEPLPVGATIEVRVNMEVECWELAVTASALESDPEPLNNAGELADRSRCPRGSGCSTGPVRSGGSASLFALAVVSWLRRRQS